MTKGGFSLAYCTNIWSHHQAPISWELARLLGERQFKLCLFEQVHEERKNLGYASGAPDCPWIAGPPSSDSEMDDLTRMVCDADVAVLGDCPQAVRVSRVATGKLTFEMSERMWKKPFYWWRMLNPRFSRGVNRFKILVDRANVHYLAMGFHAAEDARRIEAYGDRMWSWGYFAEVTCSRPQPRESEKLRLLWVGRMLKWKRVDVLLKAVKCVLDEPTFGGLDVVGTGPEEARLLRLAEKLGLGDMCVFHQPVAAERVRDLMRKADVYVFPSNRFEGWGVVINEAMSEGAVLVANRQAGAARVLIDDGRTGFLFEDGDVDAVVRTLRKLLKSATLVEDVRQAAWLEVLKTWHPRVGAERLLELCEGILGNAPMPSYRRGPCSWLEDPRLARSRLS